MAHSAFLAVPPAASFLPLSFIRAMPDVLTWQDTGEMVLLTVLNSWATLAGGQLNVTLGRISSCDPSAGAFLADKIGRLSGASFERFLLAPETTFRLLPGRPAMLEETTEFLRRSVLAESAIAGSDTTVREELWAPLGDARVDADGRVHLGPRVASFMPLDFDSPYSCRIDLEGIHYLIDEPRPPMNDQELGRTLAMLERIRNGLSTTSTFLLNFCVRLTRVLVLQRDERQPFCSGSNGDYVGRSVISNPHCALDADIADGIVHEAIHALLYMQEEQQPWVLDMALYEPIPRAISPWSNRPLPLRSFLQACFVWYGLANFWAQASRAGVFEPEPARAMFRRAASGFLRVPLRPALENFREALNPDILDTIDEMQSRIVSALGE